MSKSALSSLVAIAAATVAVAFVPVSTVVSPRTTSSALGAAERKKKIFIDGEAGTTGLQVRDRLASRADLEIISISDELRKDVGERKRLINEADCVILCEWWCAHYFARRGGISPPGPFFFSLSWRAGGGGRAPHPTCLLFRPARGLPISFDLLIPSACLLFVFFSAVAFRLFSRKKMKKGLPDDASMEAAAMVENDRTVVIDASTAYRVDDAWTYGFPELCESQKDALRSSKRISNPGCYPTGFIALTRPLVDAGLVPADAPLTVNAISGYSGGGKGLIGIYESDDHEPWGAYGFSMVSDDGWWGMMEKFCRGG